MLFKDLQKISVAMRAAITLETFAPRKMRGLIKETIILFIPVAVAVSLFFAEETLLTLDRMYGIFFAAVFFLLLTLLLDTFFYSQYFKGMHVAIPELGTSAERESASFELLHVIFESDPDDLTTGFLTSSYGRTIMKRLDIDKSEYDKFLNTRASRVHADDIRLPDNPTFSSYLAALYDNDRDFCRFLKGRGVGRTDLLATCDWVIRMIEIEKMNLRWWSRDSLGKIRGIGKEWVHGRTFTLKKYGEYLMSEDPPSKENLFEREITALERLLTRHNGVNALLVSRRARDAREVLEQLAWRIDLGIVLPTLEHKRIYILDTGKLLTSTDSKIDLERELRSILHEASNTKNLILAFEDFGHFVSRAEALDVDILDLLAPYLNSSRLHVVGLSDTVSYRDTLEKKGELLRYFEKILIEGYEREMILRYLERKISDIERRTKLFVTYQALHALAMGIKDDSRLVSRMVVEMKKKRRKTVTEGDILALLPKIATMSA